MIEDDREFDDIAKSHEFSQLQAEFLRTYLSQPGHSHTVDQIDYFDEEVSGIVNELLDEEDD
jgi:hypothetical protein